MSDDRSHVEASSLGAHATAWSRRTLSGAELDTLKRRVRWSWWDKNETLYGDELTGSQPAVATDHADPRGACNQSAAVRPKLYSLLNTEKEHFVQSQQRKRTAEQASYPRGEQPIALSYDVNLNASRSDKLSWADMADEDTDEIAKSDALLVPTVGADRSDAASE